MTGTVDCLNNPSTQFDKFTLVHTECSLVSSIEIFADMAKTAHSKLEIVEGTVDYTISVKNLAD